MLVRPKFRLVLEAADHMRETDRIEAEVLMSKKPFNLAYYLCSQDGPYWGAPFGDRIAYAFGCYRQPDQEDWAMWGFGTDDVPKVALAVNRFLRNVAFPQVWAMGAKRLVCTSLASKENVHRWFRFIGGKEIGEQDDLYGSGHRFKFFAWEAQS